MGGVEDVGTEQTVGLEREQRPGQDREGDEHQQAGDQDVPDEHRQAEHGHAGGAHADDRGDEVDRTQDRAQTGHPQTHDPQVTAHARRAHGVGERGVGEPAEVSRALGGQEARGGDQAAEEEQPVAEHVQTRERHVGRADLQRHDDVGETEEQWRREQQQHDRAVHGEELVVELVVDDLRAGREQLGTDQQRHDTADQEPRERRDEVHLADQLVIGRGQHPDHELPEGLAPALLRGVGRGGGHSPSPSVSSVSRPAWVRASSPPISGRSESLPSATRPATYSSYSSRLTTLTLKSIREW